MSSTPAPTDTSAAPPAGSYPPPAGPPPPEGSAPSQPGSGAPSAYPPPPGAPPGAPGAPPPGQQPYGSPYPPPPGGYNPYGYYPPSGGYYPPPPGQYGYQPYPGHYPPPGAPNAAPGAQPPAGQPAQPGQPGAPYYPPPSGPPPAGQYPPPAGAPPAPGQYAPAAPGAYPPYGNPAFPLALPPLGAPLAPAPAMGHQRTPSAMHDPLIYLGTNIPDPFRSPASHGEVKVAGYDPEVTFRHLNRLTAAAELKEAEVSSILLSLSVFEMDALNDHYVARTGYTLADTIDRTVGSTDWKMAVRALTLGPLGFDVDLARKALAGIGTNEMLLVELILGRQGPDVRWLKAGYKARYGKDLVDAVKNDLSGKLERLFVMALNTQKPLDDPYGQVDQRKVLEDVESLATAAKKKDEIAFAEILINRSDTHIRAVITTYSQRYKSLSKVIKKTFSGIMEAALLFILHGVKPKRDGQGIWRDAKLLEKAMAGFGTKDTQLVYRLVRAYWNPARMEGIKDAYQRRYNKPLLNRVKGETSGAYQKLLMSIITISERKEMPDAPK